MIKGLAITPPVIGRISIGRVVEKNGKRLPEKDDQFTITTQVQGKDGWILHPLDKQLREEAHQEKLRAIPVRLVFNDPDLNFRAQYTLFDRQKGRPVCVGNGETCRRNTGNGIETLPCPAPEGCELAKGGMCKPYGRLNVRIGDDDELGTFIFRTTGFNSIRCLYTRLQYLKAVSGNLLSALPLELRLRAKSTTMSFGAAVYYVDLTARTGQTLVDAIKDAKETDHARAANGFDQAALEEAAHLGFQNGAFEDSDEDGADLVEEFYPVEGKMPDRMAPAMSPEAASPSLRERLTEKTESISR